MVKAIQKLTGKLGQKVREASTEEMDAEMTKYVLNSVMSALDLSLLSEEDIEEAIERLEAGEEQIDDEAGEAEGGMEEPMEFPEEPAGEEEPMELSESTMTKGKLLESIDDYYEEDYDHVDTVYEEEETVEETCDCGDTVAEEETVEEGEPKPDFLDLDKDGDTEEPMKDAAKSVEEVAEEVVSEIWDDALSGEFYGSPQPAEQPDTAPVEAPPQTEPSEPVRHPRRRKFNPGPKVDPRPKGLDGA